MTTRYSLFSALLIALLLLAAPPQAAASFFTDTMDFEDIQVRGSSKGAVIKEAKKKAVEMALLEFNIDSASPLYANVMGGNLDDFVTEYVVDVMQARGSGFVGVLTCTVDGNRMYEFVQSAIAAAAEAKGNPKIATAFIMTSSMQTFTGDIEEHQEGLLRSLNATVREAMGRVGFTTLDVPEITDILHGAASSKRDRFGYNVANFSAMVRKIEKKLINVAKMKDVPFIALGVVDINNEKMRRGRLIFGARVNGYILDVNSGKTVDFSDNVSRSGKAPRDTAESLFRAAGNEVMVTKGVVLLANDWLAAKSSGRVKVKICKAKDRKYFKAIRKYLKANGSLEDSKRQGESFYVTYIGAMTPDDLADGLEETFEGVGVFPGNGVIGISPKEAIACEM